MLLLYRDRLDRSGASNDGANDERTGGIEQSLIERVLDLILDVFVARPALRPRPAPVWQLLVHAVLH